jgi:hypothetical protein
MACQRRANWQKNSSKVRDKWQRKILGMSIYATFGSPLFLMLPNYVPNVNIVFHGMFWSINDLTASLRSVTLLADSP